MIEIMISIILAVLATYRLARMFALEDGPADVFANLRNRFDSDSWFARGLRCPLCVGFWIALGVALLVPFSSWQMFILTWLGIAGAQAIIYLVTEPSAE